jgi:hypothetical protein
MTPSGRLGMLVRAFPLRPNLLSKRPQQKESKNEGGFGYLFL